MYSSFNTIKKSQKLLNDISTSNRTDQANSSTPPLMNTNRDAAKNKERVNVQTPKMSLGDSKGQSSGITLPLRVQSFAKR